MGEELSHLSIAEQKELLEISGWHCTGIMRQRNSAVAVYEYVKEADDGVYKTYIPFEAATTGDE